jgi:hypothetical protein
MVRMSRCGSRGGTGRPGSFLPGGVRPGRLVATDGAAQRGGIGFGVWGVLRRGPWIDVAVAAVPSRPRAARGPRAEDGHFARKLGPEWPAPSCVLVTPEGAVMRFGHSRGRSLAFRSIALRSMRLSVGRPPAQVHKQPRPAAAPAGSTRSSPARAAASNSSTLTRWALTRFLLGRSPAARRTPSQSASSPAPARVHARRARTGSVRRAPSGGCTGGNSGIRVSHRLG